jgi:hypothetical protein
LERFHACRTEKITCGIDSPDKFDSIELKKAFSQGSALTFPCQSVVYAIVCAAAVIITKKDDTHTPVTMREVNDSCSRIRVYGDDLIVPTDTLTVLTDLLSFLQLKVNDAKTHSKGKFRESCGLDGYDGFDVTPTYIKIVDESPKHETVVSAIESSNNLLKNGWWNLSTWQLGIAKLYAKAMPYKRVHEQALAVSTFSGPKTTHLRSRWNENLQVEEVNVFTLTSNTRRVEPERGLHRIHQWFTEEPEPDTVWSAGETYEAAAVMRLSWKPRYHYQG